MQLVNELSVFRSNLMVYFQISHVHVSLPNLVWLCIMFAPVARRLWVKCLTTNWFPLHLFWPTAFCLVELIQVSRHRSINAIRLKHQLT